MKRKLKDRVLSALLSLTMVVTSIPMSSYAAETPVPDDAPEQSQYYLFIDQQAEFGKITDADDKKVYFDVNSEDSEDEASADNLELLYKATDYEAGAEVELKIKADDGYAVADAFVEKVETDGTDVEYNYDSETGILSFTMPEANIYASATFEKIPENVNTLDEPLVDDAGDSSNGDSTPTNGDSNPSNGDSVNPDEGDSSPIAPAGDDPSVTNDIYIRHFSTQLFYGATKTDDGYVWTAKEYDKGHRISFRINYAISGVDTAAENTIQFTIPKSILLDRDGLRADEYEMSVPSLADVEAYQNGTGESIDQDVNWAYYENGDNIIIYNFREIPAGDNGYIELSYFTTKTTYDYVDMGAGNDFTCTMTVPNEQKTADPISVKINTSASISSTNKRYPTKYTSWQSSWGDEVKPENAANYNYLVWTIESYISATQPYKFTLEDSMESNLGGMEVLGYRFSGNSAFTAQNYVENQTQIKYRYDYVITSIPLDVYGEETYWQADNSIVATVDPVDQIDDDTQASATKTWSWTKPVFSDPGGSFNVWKRSDGAYRRYYPWASSFYGTVHKASSLDYSASEYSRYDLETFNGYNGAVIENDKLDGFKYASWIVGYPYPWTYDAENFGSVKVPEGYGKIPVSYELVDENVYISGDNDDESDDVLLTSEDFSFESLGFSWYMSDAVLDEELQQFVASPVTYTDEDILVFYGKFGDSTEWVQFATYDLKNGVPSYEEAYVASMTNNNIVFKKDAGLVAYRITTSNAHYYTEVFTVPHLTLKNSQTVMDYVTDKDSIAIINHNYGYVYNNAGEKIWENDKVDMEYARISQRYSDLEKEIVSVSNNTKKKTFTISWKVTEKEEMEWGAGGERQYIPQNGGTFYDLLPDGAVVNRNSVDVETSRGTFLSTSAYSVTTIENFKNTGRTMLIVKIKSPADHYSVYYDTVHSWNSIKDYGTLVYNPVAYETGNTSMTNGFPDNGGQYNADGSANTSAIRDAALMAGLTEDTADDASVRKFIYTEKEYDIAAITAASSGLMKKVKAEKDTAYSYDTTTTINGDYSYQLRYMNSYTSASKNMIFYDSLENYDYDTMKDFGTLSDWRGTLTGIDVKQLEAKGIAPVIYYSTISKLDIEAHNDLSDGSVWSVMTDSTDLSAVKAIAIDMRKGTDGNDFVLDMGESVTATLYMKAPAECPEKTGGYAYAYNNVYMANTVLGSPNDTEGQDFLIHQDYTSVKLLVTGSFGLTKVSSESEETKIESIQFRLMGTSDYGTKVDEIIATDMYGQIYFEDVEKGTYILQEYEATEDWLLDTTEHTVVIDRTGKVWVDNVDYTDNYITLKDDPRIHGDFSFYKKELGDDTTGVMGATFRLSGTSDYGNEVLMYATSANNGKVDFENIELGTYELVEVATNQNYVLNDIIYTVVVDENGNVAITGSNEVDADDNPVSLEDSEWYDKAMNGTVTIFNAYRFYEVELRKVDAENPTIFLQGATFNLSGVSESGTKVDMTVTSDENGFIAFNGIEKGLYILQETEAPTNVDANGKTGTGGTLNYIMNNTQYIVEVKYDGTVVIDGLTQEEGTGYFVMKNSRAYDKQIVITKVWDDGLTTEERLAAGIIPKIHLTTRDLTKDENFHVHIWDAGKVITETTCEHGGETLYTCTDCGVTYNQLEEQKPHTWNSGEVTTPASCSEEGVMTYTCVNCGATKTSKIEKTPHTWGSDGVCTACGETLTYATTVMNDVGEVTLSVSSASGGYDYYNSSNKPNYAKIITFIPTTSGTYSFKGGASADTYGRIYDADMKSLVYDDDSGGNSQFKVSYAMTAGTVYYVAVGFYSSSSTARDLPVTITKS